jgi:hypothetical protein
MLGTRIAFPMAGALWMKVRLTRTLARVLDGVDLSSHAVGDVIDLPPEHARLVIAEDWAIPERRAGTDAPSAPRRRADDLRPGPPDTRLLRAS